MASERRASCRASGGLVDGGDEAGDDGEQREPGRGQRGSVPAQELPQPIRPAGAARGDRLASEMAAYVFGQRLH